MVAFGEYAEDGTASTLKSRDYKDATDLVAEASTGDVSRCLNAGGMGRLDYETETLVAHSLRAEGFDASEDGTGRGTPLVPVAFHPSQDPISSTDGSTHALGCGSKGGQASVAVAVPLQEVGKRTGTSTDDPRAGIGIGQDGDPMFTLQAGAQHGVAYPLDLRNAGRDPEKLDDVNRQGLGVGADGDPSPTISTAFVPGVAYAFQPRIARNGRGDMGDVVNALNAQSGETGKGDAAPCVAVAVQASQSGFRVNDTVGTLDANYGSRRHNGVMQHMAVRRLTPRECEALQGFPADYTLIPWKKKPASECPDGPRYKALGNSMAVPVMHWIGHRIDAHVRSLPPCN